MASDRQTDRHHTPFLGVLCWHPEVPQNKIRVLLCAPTASFPSPSARLLMKLSLSAEVLGPEEAVESSASAVGASPQRSASGISWRLRISTGADPFASYTLLRRYRQFEALHTSLTACFNRVPTLPPKRTSLESRQAGLGTFLDSLLADATLSAQPEL